MRGWFKRRPVVHVKQPSRGEIQELLILRWHGHTPEQWVALPHDVQTEKRDTVTWARTV